MTINLDPVLREPIVIQPDTGNPTHPWWCELCEEGDVAEGPDERERQIVQHAEDADHHYRDEQGRLRFADGEPVTPDDPFDFS